MKKNYAERTRQARDLGLIWAVLSLCLLIAGVLANQFGYLPADRMSGFCGFTCGMTGAGFGVFLQKRRVLRDPARLRQQEIRDHDERNQLLNKAAAQGGFWGFLLLNYLFSFFALFLKPELYLLLCGQILIMLALYLLAAWYCRKKW